MTATVQRPDAAGCAREVRQGIGRLIRTQTDRGLVTILDSRVVAKNYGRLFLECLPKRAYERLTRETGRRDLSLSFEASPAKFAASTVYAHSHGRLE